MFDFTGKVALVTGSGGGIGLATAKAFAECGADVALLDFNPALLETAKPEVEQYGHKVITIQCDVSKADQVDAAVKQTVSRGWKSLQYASEELLSGSVPSWDTAAPDAFTAKTEEEKARNWRKDIPEDRIF